MSGSLLHAANATSMHSRRTAVEDGIYLYSNGDHFSALDSALHGTKIVIKRVLRHTPAAVTALVIIIHTFNRNDRHISYLIILPFYLPRPLPYDTTNLSLHWYFDPKIYDKSLLDYPPDFWLTPLTSG